MKLNAIEFLAGCMAEYLALQPKECFQKFSELCEVRLKADFLEIEPKEIGDVATALTRIRNVVSACQVGNIVAFPHWKEPESKGSN